MSDVEAAVWKLAAGLSDSSSQGHDKRRHGYSGCVAAAAGRGTRADGVMFLRACLGQLQRATAERVPVDGYVYWSAQDNFEWMDGFGNRFGLV